MHKAEGVAVAKQNWFVLTLAWFVLGGGIRAQELPRDEIQANLSGYFDNFRVIVIYPNISASKRISETTGITGRYLVDAISAASMRSQFTVDGVTSATSRTSGGSDNTPDELRHEFGAGITQLIAGRTLAVNTLYSTEHDYTSTTLAGNFTQLFAKKNTTLQLGVVRSWDKVFPQNRTWKRDKNVVTYSGDLSQILSKRLIAQLIFSYNETSGFLSDNYQVVTIIDGDRARRYEPVHPDSRLRRAAAMRVNYLLTSISSLRLGYRYYWDTWDVNSHTFSGFYQRYLGSATILGLGLRRYNQSRAFFFQPSYSEPLTYMSVDSKLNSGYTNELEFQLTLDGSSGKWPQLGEKTQLNFSLNFFHRHTDSADWHSRRKNLYAYYTNIGLRYRF